MELIHVALKNHRITLPKRTFLHLKQEVASLHSELVICTADKASGNYVLVCKKYYLEVICKELGISANGEISGNETYKVIDISADELIDKHRTLCLRYGQKFDGTSAILPNFYGIPKLHKKPYKFRFIAAASRSSMKPLSLLLHRVLVTVREKIKQYCRTIYKREGRRYYWSIDNSFKALQFLSNQENCTDILAADFSTLHTMLPHNVVLNALEKMVKLTLKDDRKICTNGYKTYVTDREPHGYFQTN